MTNKLEQFLGARIRALHRSYVALYHMKVYNQLSMCIYLGLHSFKMLNGIVSAKSDLNLFVFQFYCMVCNVFNSLLRMRSKSEYLSWICN